MTPIRSWSFVLAFGVASFACSSAESVPPSPTPDEPATEPPPEDVGPTGEDAGTPGAAPGSVDPTGNPILLGTARTVRTFTPPGGVPLFVDGLQWIAAKDALFASLPFATNLKGGKGILTTFKSDGTNYTELRAGDKVSTGVVGNSIDKDGNLISAELQSITRTIVATGAVTVIATGAPFAGPNDLIGLTDGSIFVTDPGYGVVPRPAVGRLFRIAPNGTVSVAASYDFNPSPNGIALSKNEKLLFVSFTAPAGGIQPYLRKYGVGADGSLADLGKLVELPAGCDPDGLAVDDNDNIYVAMKTGVAVFKANGEPYGGTGANVPQTIIEGGATSLTFGGADRKSLFVTTNGKALELRTMVPGLRQ